MAALNQTGQQTLTVSTTAVPLTLPTASNKSRPKRVLIFCGPVGAATTNFVRWRADGTNPTATAGMVLQVGDYLDLTSMDGQEADFYGTISRIKFIRDTSAAADATLEIAYFA